MKSTAKEGRSTVSVSMLYRNAPAAIEWLCDVFGFEKHAVYPGANGTIAHAELTFGNGMIMLGSAAPSEYSKLMVHPDETGLRNTHNINLISTDPDAVYEKAKQAGAEIVSEIEDKHYGGRGFSCRDLEGYLWHVGSYDPWDKK